MRHYVFPVHIVKKVRLCSPIALPVPSILLKASARASIAFRVSLATTIPMLAKRNARVVLLANLPTKQELHSAFSVLNRIFAISLVP